MANSKTMLLATQNLFSVFILTFLLLITNVKSETFSFTFPEFDNDTKSIALGGDAIINGGVLQLTKKDQLGKPIPHSFGLSAFNNIIHLYAKNGEVADFTTDFLFVVNPKGSQLHGDGFTFFISSLGFEFPDNSSSEGGFLGLFDKETAFNTSKNSIVAVEFDSFTNEWDPLFPENSPHIGIDINTIESSITVPWPIDRQPEGSIGKALISYNSASKELSVLVTYPNSPVKVEVGVSYPVDFGAVLSEWVLVGFSGSTGQLAETHDILSWSFASNL
ncbi:lectin [Trifolium pratense]|uniref:Lectin n=1 Tax=Trifolium pratense TaxID=57577 RepID=A0A2K3LQR1_TRIPR|nr:lectin 8-like [Trifolium pratense]PNX80871.1 lectin [Trifolium pratense]